MSQYWGALANFLTKLKLSFNEDITPEMSSALNQLTQLKGLMLEGFGENAAAVHLQLPQLMKLTLCDFGNTNVFLECPQLLNFKLTGLESLQEMTGMPAGMEKLKLDEIGDEAVPLEQMLPVEGLKSLSDLFLHRCPGQRDALRGAYIPSKLTCLSADEAWVPF